MSTLLPPQRRLEIHSLEKPNQTMEMGSAQDTQKGDQMKLGDTWVAPVHKVVLISPQVVGDIDQIFSGPFLLRGTWFVHLHSFLCNCLPSLSLSLVSWSWPQISSSSQAGYAGPRVPLGICKLINRCFVPFLSFLEKLFPFETMGTVVAFFSPLGPSSHMFTCFQFHMFSKVIAKYFAITFVNSFSPTLLVWIYPFSNNFSSTLTHGFLPRSDGNYFCG